MVSSGRSIGMLCLAQIFLLYLMSMSFQLIAIHRIDDSFNTSNLLTSSHNTYNAKSTTNNNNNEDSKPTTTTTRPVIAYVVTLTGCGNDKRYTRDQAMGLVTQGAAVLRHSIALAHTTPVKSKYDFQMYALVHPSAKECSTNMSKLGYTVLVRNTPFTNSDIHKEFLREHVDGASCCGAKEYIKLYAYTLVQHPVAVILDLDSLVLKPLDDLFDAMLLEDETTATVGESSIPFHHEEGSTNNSRTKRKKIDAFYTRDYNMVNAGGEKYAGVQGGFLMVKPSEQLFEEYIDIILEGDYRDGQGWGGKYGYFFGGMQIQGICAYFYGERHPTMGMELDRCRVNSMVDNPYFRMDDKKKPGECRDGRSKCEDCRTTDIADILSAHFTICQKPWECQADWDTQSTRLCSQLHGEWFRIRRSFEESRLDVDDENGNLVRQLPDLAGAFKPETYFGYCTQPGRRGYLPIKI